jgi:hypothetical protein
MPTVLRHDGIRVDIIPGDRISPHAHTYYRGGEAVFNIESGKARDVRGMRPHDVAKVRRLVIDHREMLMQSWGVFNGKG